LEAPRSNDSLSEGGGSQADGPLSEAADIPQADGSGAKPDGPTVSSDGAMSDVLAQQDSDNSQDADALVETGPDASNGNSAMSDGAADPGCTNVLSQTGQETGFETCSDGTRRSAAITCPTEEVSAASPCSSDEACTSDAECAANAAAYNAVGEMAYCANIRNLAHYCGCFYGCQKDSDCKSGFLCQCGVVLGGCVPATCTDNSSCGSGLNCIATQTASDAGACGATVSFACETPKDLCHADPDCGVGQACLMQGDHRACSAACPMMHVGRPFLVRDEVRRAEPVRRSDWMAEGAVPDTRHLSADLRARLADHWTQAALMEHASVAAFARFALELLAIGAPANLVRDTQQAMGDEIEHARLCFGLASAYAGTHRGPATVSMRGVTPSADTRAIVRALLREGCIGETVAAVEAVEMGGRATDPVVRKVLALIARDETNHAALSWRALAWIIVSSREEDRAAFRDELESALEAAHVLARAEMTYVDPAPLQAHAVADVGLRGIIRRQALVDIVEPAARACFGAAASGRVCADVGGLRGPPVS
jgi:hypothetical protein